MKIRLFLVLITFALTSCNELSFSKKSSRQSLDTIIDFTKVDVYPSFIVCDHLEGKAKRTCFEKQVQRRLTSALKKQNFLSKHDVDETVLLTILIDKTGAFTLEEIQSSVTIQENLPTLDDILTSSIHNFPKIAPAIKKGIPVATQYQLPIKIKS